MMDLKPLVFHWPWTERGPRQIFLPTMHPGGTVVPFISPDVTSFNCDPESYVHFCLYNKDLFGQSGFFGSSSFHWIISFKTHPTWQSLVPNSVSVLRSSLVKGTISDFSSSTGTSFQGLFDCFNGEISFTVVNTQTLCLPGCKLISHLGFFATLILDFTLLFTKLCDFLSLNEIGCTFYTVSSSLRL